MKITVELDPDCFERFYEMVRYRRQEKNGRAVDRKAARAHFIHDMKWAMAETWDDGLTEEVNLYIADLDKAYKKTCPLYRMVKEHEPA